MRLERPYIRDEKALSEHWGKLRLNCVLALAWLARNLPFKSLWEKGAERCLKRFVRAAEKDVFAYAMLRARLSMGPRRPRRKAAVRPFFAPAGFRVKLRLRGAASRLARKRLPETRVPLLERLRILRDHINNLEPLVARCRAMLARAKPSVCFIFTPIAPPAQTLAEALCAHEPAPADTS